MDRNDTGKDHSTPPHHAALEAIFYYIKSKNPVFWAGFLLYKNLTMSYFASGRTYWCLACCAS
jgi:hypothetical protein